MTLSRTVVRERVLVVPAFVLHDAICVAWEEDLSAVHCEINIWPWHGTFARVPDMGSNRYRKAVDMLDVGFSTSSNAWNSKWHVRPFFSSLNVMLPIVS